MKIIKHGRSYCMDSLEFTAKGIPFLITGTRTDKNEVDIKNLLNGKTATIEHQRLCVMIIEAQRTEKPKINKSILKYRQSGLNL